MPATFPSHAAVVLSLKVAAPRRFDGVALVVGSTAPDLAYPLAAIVNVPETHAPLALLWFCLPVTLLASAMIRAGAPVIAAHLPHSRWFAFADYGVLGRSRPTWPKTVWSALIGAGTHLLWDGFTHDPAYHGWAVAGLPGLDRIALADLAWWQLLQQVSTVFGAVAAVIMFSHIGRHRLVREWHGAAPEVRRAPRVFWTVAVLVFAAYPISWPFLTHVGSAHVQGVRMLWALAFGLLAGAVAVRVQAAWTRRKAGTAADLVPVTPETSLVGENSGAK